jgi:Type IV secretory system Conjugative DNA transfer
MVSGLQDWGPPHQTTGGASNKTVRKWLLSVIEFLALLGLGNRAAWGESTATVVSRLVVLGVIGWFVIPDRNKQLIRRVFRRRQRPRIGAGVSGDPLEAFLDAADRHGGGVYLGRVDRGGWRHARPERAVLVVGPARSGKTTGVIIRALLSHSDPAVSTSTKPDVASAPTTAAGTLGSRLESRDFLGRLGPLAPSAWSVCLGWRTAAVVGTGVSGC